MALPAADKAGKAALEVEGTEVPEGGDGFTPSLLFSFREFDQGYGFPFFGLAVLSKETEFALSFEADVFAQI